MNFFKHHIGDYASATEHLTWDEDQAYTRLMRVYYRDERPLPLDTAKVVRLVRAQTPSQKKAVDAVLNEFFIKQEDGWHNKRCDVEIAQASNQADTNRRIAADREAAKEAAKLARIANDSLHGSSNGSLHVASTNRSTNRQPIQTPDSISHKPDTRTEKIRTAHRTAPTAPIEFLDFKIAYPTRGGDQGWRKAQRAAEARLREGHTWTEIVEGARRYANYVRSTGNEGTEFVKQAATFLGPDLFFKQTWELPKSKAEVHRDANVENSQEWLNASNG